MFEEQKFLYWPYSENWVLFIGWADNGRGGIKNKGKDLKKYQDVQLQGILKHSFLCIEHSAMWNERVLNIYIYAEILYAEQGS